MTSTTSASRTGCVILEVEKNSMVARGEWIAMHPERTDHLSFHLNALVSPFDGARWPVLVDEWYKTERKPEKVRVFVNTVLGETYVEEGEQADGDTLTQRRDEARGGAKKRPVPAGAAVLTGRSTRRATASRRGVGVGRGRRMLAGRLGAAARRSGDDGTVGRARRANRIRKSTGD
jgi:phage terminase large subunit GpA-like protein